MSSPRIEELDKRLRRCLASCAEPRLASSRRNKASDQLRNLAEQAGGLGLSGLIEEVGTFFLTRERLRELQQEVGFPTRQFFELGRHSLATTLQFGITDSPEAFAALPAEMLLKEVPSPLLLDKIAKKRTRLLPEAIAILQKQPDLASGGAGLPWVVSKAKIEHLFPLLSFIFAERSESSDPQRTSELRVKFLSRDKTGKGISEVLVRISEGELVPESLIDGLRSCPEAAAVFVRILPKLLSKNVGAHAVSALEHWLPCLPEISRPKRAVVSGALAVLSGTLLLKPKRNALEETLFLLVTSAMEQMSLQIGADVSGLWGLFRMGEKPLRGGSAQFITAEGARLLIESMEKLEDERYSPSEVCTALAINLGLALTNQLGDKVIYDPKQHDDSVGGLLRGQPAVVLRSGWRFKDATLLKTKVKSETIHA